MDDINIKAFEFVKLIEEKIIPNESKEKLENTKSLIGIGEPINLGEAQNLRVYSFDEDGYKDEHFKDVDGTLIGLSKENYSGFKEIIRRLCEQPLFRSSATVEFIEDRSFDWLLNVYKEGKAKDHLTGYLLQKIEEENKQYTFYYKLNFVGIEKEFQIGHVLITHFDSNYLNEQMQLYLNTAQNATKENFERIFKNFEKSVIAKVKISSLYEKAKIITLKEAEHSIDILKIFLLEHSMILQYQMLDLDHRMNKNHRSEYMYNYPSSHFSFHSGFFHLQGIMPIELSSDLINKLFAKGMDMFSKFLLIKPNKDLNYEIKRLITQLSDAYSTRNLYERVVKLVTLFESVLTDENLGRSKGQSLLKKKIFPVLGLKEHQIKSANEIVNHVYSVRDKYLHNDTELRIDLSKLNDFQLFALEFIKHMVSSYDKYENMKQYIEKL